MRCALLYGVVPFVIVSTLFYAAFRDRSDYLGHYAAGYGGTLCAAVVVLAFLTRAALTQRAYAVVGITLLCIAAGAVAEVTVFKLAQFDPIDFFNQSLGAIMAGLAALGLAQGETVADWSLRLGSVIGLLAMLVGVYFALS